MEKEYTGDIIIVDRLFYIMINNMAWNKIPITIEKIKSAIEKNIKEESNAFGNQDSSKYRHIKEQSDMWHIRRIIYFINHPCKIKDLHVDNICNGAYISTIPIITDGNHRFLAARYLNLEKVHCKYDGRMDLLDYLTGDSDECPLE